MNQDRGRRDGRLWLAVLVVSAVLSITAGWRLATGDGAGVAAEEPAETASASSPITSANPSAGSSPTATAGDDQASGWPTRDATAEQTRADQPAVPEQLIIPRVKLKMPVVPTTVDEAGLMALPERPTSIGWYSYGPRPGAKGSAVLGGHIDSRRYGIGPLTKLRRLSRGDEVIVRSGSSGSLTFTVESVRVINKRALPLREIFDRDGSPRLRIVSCGGPYVPARGGYQDNVVITATPR